MLTFYPSRCREGVSRQGRHRHLPGPVQGMECRRSGGGFVGEGTSSHTLGNHLESGTRGFDRSNCETREERFLFQG